MLTSPLFYFFCLSATFFFIICIRRFRIVLFLVAPFWLISYLSLTGFGANLAVKTYSYDIQNTNCSNNFGVLLPSGLWRLPNNLQDYQSISEDSFRRINSAIQWLKEKQDRTLLISGDGGHSKYSEAEVIFNYMTEFEVDNSRLSFEDKSSSTHLSALNLSKKTSSNNITLLTSQLHMRRAKGTFEKVGFDVCPLITDYQFQDTSGSLRFFPNAHATLKSEKTLHEIIGYLWYLWTDRL